MLQPLLRLLFAAAAASAGSAGASEPIVGIVAPAGTDRDPGAELVCAVCDPGSAAPAVGAAAARAAALRPVPRPSTGCPNASSVGNVSGSVVLFERGNCSFSAFGGLAAGAAAVLVGNDGNQTLVSPMAGIPELPVCMVGSADAATVRRMGRTVRLYQPTPPPFDYGVALALILLATACVGVGSVWSCYEERQELYGDDSADPLLPEGDDDTRRHEQNDEAATLSMSSVLSFLVIASTLLVLLFYFYRYLVYVLMAVFVLFGTTALYVCITTLTPERWLVGRRTLPVVGRMSGFAVATALGCLGIGVWWFLSRHRWYAWMLQDVLGCAFMASATAAIRVPNLKLCTVFLIALLVYDVFFVFITPYITKDGSSVMVRAATGDQSSASCDSETLPFLIRIPRGATALRAAWGRDTVACSFCPAEIALGFGDVVLPSLLVAFSMRFDTHVLRHGLGGRSLDDGFLARNAYGVAALSAYAAGLVAAFAALQLSQTPQPALLYLSPLTLGAVWTVGGCRGQLRPLLRGIGDGGPAGSSDDADEPSDDQAPLSVNCAEPQA